MELILSGYGSDPQTTLALYQYEETKSFHMLWRDSIESPSFVCQGGGYLFTITEAENNAIVYVYRRAGNQYQLSDQRKLEGGALCHITYSGKNEALFGACYGTGTIFSIRVSEGKFGEIIYQEKLLGSVPEAITRAHCVLLNKEETILIVTNIALDKIYFYEITDGSLKFIRELNMPEGVGPRHALLSQNEKYLYIITEYSNDIFVFENSKEKQLIQRVSTLSENYTGISYCSTMCFSKNGAFLYAANRGADTITIFAVTEDGKLNKIDESSCCGKYPRHMIISEDGTILAVCNQNSDEVVLFELELEKGFIRSKTASVSFTAPSGIFEVK